jgi:hypothetical protein
LGDPRPIDYDKVAVERSKERRECSYYEKCLIRAGYEAPGLWVPCAACQGTPADLPGLKAIVRHFQACREPVEQSEPWVKPWNPHRAGGQHIFAFAELEKIRAWLQGRDTSKIFVYPPRRITHNFG